MEKSELLLVFPVFNLPDFEMSQSLLTRTLKESIAEQKWPSSKHK